MTICRARRTAALAALAAAALTACSGGGSVPFATAPVATPTTATRSVGPLEVAVAPAAQEVSPDGATARYDTVTVTGGGPSVAARIRISANKVVEAAVDRFTTRAAAATTVRGPAKRVDVRARTGRWKGYVTLRVTAVETIGAATSSTSVAFVWSATDGKRLTAGDLFADPAAVSAAVRRAVGTARPGASAAALRALSVAADGQGRTAPLSCVPVAAGLECAVDSGALGPAAAGLVTVTLPWASLEGRLRADLEV